VQRQKGARDYLVPSPHSTRQFSLPYLNHLKLFKTVVDGFRVLIVLLSKLLNVFPYGRILRADRKPDSASGYRNVFHCSEEQIMGIDRRHLICWLLKGIE